MVKLTLTYLACIRLFVSLSVALPKAKLPQHSCTIPYLIQYSGDTGSSPSLCIETSMFGHGHYQFGRDVFLWITLVTGSLAGSNIQDLITIQHLYVVRTKDTFVWKRRKSYYKIVLSFPLQGKSLLRSEFSLILSISSLPPLKKYLNKIIRLKDVFFSITDWIIMEKGFYE